MPRWLRVRTRYFALAVGTILLGLAVHLRGGALSPAVRDILGDALWAAMAAWWIAAVAPAIRLPWRATMALAFCFAIEFSQLVHFPALDTLRRTTAGHLVLGSGFDPRDFASYAAGVLAAVLLEQTIDAARTNPSQDRHYTGRMARTHEKVRFLPKVSRNTRWRPPPKASRMP